MNEKEVEKIFNAMFQKHNFDRMQISLQQRYQAAWLEINARLQSRQTVEIVYITGVIFAVQNGSHGSLSKPNHWEPTIIFLLPILTLVVSLWAMQSDLTIGLLSAFCRHCEKIDNENNTKMPEWHSREQGYQAISMDFRRISNIASLIISIIPLAALLMIESSIFGGEDGVLKVYYCISFSAGLASILILFISMYMRHIIYSKFDFDTPTSKMNFGENNLSSKDSGA